MNNIYDYIEEYFNIKSKQEDIEKIIANTKIDISEIENRINTISELNSNISNFEQNIIAKINKSISYNLTTKFKTEIKTLWTGYNIYKFRDAENKVIKTICISRDGYLAFKDKHEQYPNTIRTLAFFVECIENKNVFEQLVKITNNKAFVKRLKNISIAFKNFNNIVTICEKDIISIELTERELKIFNRIYYSSNVNTFTINTNGEINIANKDNPHINNHTYTLNYISRYGSDPDDKMIIETLYSNKEKVVNKLDEHISKLKKYAAPTIELEEKVNTELSKWLILQQMEVDNK